MSYCIANGISIKKDGSIQVCGCDNNVFPKIITKAKFNGDKYALFKCLCGRTIQPRTSANGYKWAYIMEMIKKMVAINGDTLDSVYKLFFEGTNKERIELYKSLFDSILQMADSCKKEKYKLKNGMYFICDNVPGGKRWYLTENEKEAQVFPAYKARYFSMVNGYDLIQVK